MIADREAPPRADSRLRSGAEVYRRGTLLRGVVDEVLHWPDGRIAGVWVEWLTLNGQEIPEAVLVKLVAYLQPGELEVVAD